MAGEVRQELLTAADLAVVLGMSRSALQRYLADHPHFPQPVVLGQTPAGKPIHRWRRRDVDAFITLLGG